jgi:hypothetical protein
MRHESSALWWQAQTCQHAMSMDVKGSEQLCRVHRKQLCSSEHVQLVRARDTPVVASLAGPARCCRTPQVPQRSLGLCMTPQEDPSAGSQHQDLATWWCPLARCLPVGTTPASRQMLSVAHAGCANLAVWCCPRSSCLSEITSAHDKVRAPHTISGAAHLYGRVVLATCCQHVCSSPSQAGVVTLHQLLQLRQTACTQPAVGLCDQSSHQTSSIVFGFQ